MASFPTTSSASRTRPLSTVPAIDDAVALRVAVARIHRALRTLPNAGLTLSQASALSRVEQLGPLRIGVLAQLEGVSAASMSGVVEGLEARGLIEREPDALDGRASQVRVSERGNAMLYELRASSTQAIHEALAALGAHDLALVQQALPVLEALSVTLQTAIGQVSSQHRTR